MYDLAIIGTGAAGVQSAKSALSAGLKTVLIEKERGGFGGTCINYGCIPTKLFLNLSKHNKSWTDIFKKKNEVLEQIKAPLLSFLEKQGLHIVWGHARFIDKNTLNVEGREIKAKNIIIATGSSPRAILNHPKVIFAKDLFKHESLPDKILVVGGGYIGMELASLFFNLGKDARVVEKEKDLLISFERSLVKRLKVVLEKKGIKIETGKDACNCNLDDFDLVVSAVGNIPNTKGLGIEVIGLETSSGGWVKTDEFMRTNIDNIYACGDVTGKKLLAYAAELQANICIKNILGGKEKEDYSGIAECVFSQPSLAQVGILEEEAQSKGISCKVIKSNFLKFSSPYVYDDKDGFIKIIIDDKDQIIGAGIISQSAAELINIISLCIRNNLTLSDLQKCVFIHPTLSEIITLLLGSESPHI